MFEIVIGATVSGILYAIEQYNATKKEKKKILEALLEAIELTKHHLENSDTSEEETRASTELYKAWKRLSDRIKKFDENNARAFEDKSKYWLKPNTWIQEVCNKDEKRRLEMTLENVNVQYWKLKTIWK